MWNFVFLFIVLASVGVLFYIIWDKLPQLANLDIDNLPEEKFYRKKKEIIYKRMDEKNKIAQTQLAVFLRPLQKLWGNLQLRFRIYVGKIERLLHYEKMKKQKQEQNLMTKEEKEQKLKLLVSEGQNSLQVGDLDRAEESFIAAIKLDVKSRDAYRGLGDVYFAKGALEESKQTYMFLLQLDRSNDYAMVKLAEIAEQQNDWQNAIKFYEQAVVINDSLSPRFVRLAELLNKVGHPEIAEEAIAQAIELEPQNPKYLDLLIETAILCGDKKIAVKGFEQLRMVNPENKKLPDFKDRIDKI
jgi:tetratricopeptide (TPR) repeat protein